MEIQSDEWKAYINRKTGELSPSRRRRRSGPDFDGEDEDDDEDEGASRPEPDLDRPSKIKEVLSSEELPPLPTKYEIHEWSIMDRFAQSLDDDEAQPERLERAIRGRGAFGISGM